LPRKKLRAFKFAQDCPLIIEEGKEVYEELKKTKDWSEVFDNKNPITLELGCGRGEYTVGLSKQFPDRNFIGIDVKADRLWRGAQQILSRKPNMLSSQRKVGSSNCADSSGFQNKSGITTNAIFLRTQVENLNQFFTEGSIAAIWIPFPDPRPKKGEARKRLVSSRFLEIYKTICKKDGIIHLKTDNKKLFDYALDAIGKDPGSGPGKALGKSFAVPDRKIELSEIDSAPGSCIEIKDVTEDLYDSKYLDLHCGVQTNFEKKYLEKELPIYYLTFRIDK